MSDTQFDYYKKYEPFFGNWYIKEKVGEGSFGEVFRIEREDFGMKYVSALKVIKLPKSQSDIDAVRSEGLDEKTTEAYFKSLLEEMINEFSLMAKLKGQSNIVSYEDHMIVEHKDEIGWDIFIRMELLTPLRTYQKDKLQTEKEVIKLGIDMCAALELCDKFDIIHRDIKPENIFVSDTGNFKLGDFGIARTAEKSKGASTKVGTSNYMAPEIFRGEVYSRNVDYYSLGLVLHRLLNDNRGPFYPPAPEPVTYQVAEAAKKRRIVGEPIPDPVNGSKEIGDIIRKASAFVPGDRYESATEFKKDLQQLLFKLEANGGSLPKSDRGPDFDYNSIAPKTVSAPVTANPVQAEQPVAKPVTQARPVKMFCTKCGKDITAAKVPVFCRFCGNTIPLATRNKYMQMLQNASGQNVAQAQQVAPARPVMPMQQVAPAQPVQQAMPVQPAQPVQKPVPVQPVQQAVPVQPVQQAMPVQPVAPVSNMDDEDEKTLSVFASHSPTVKEPVTKEPDIKEPSVAPAPVMPGRPVTPMQPVNQVQPATYAQPVQPAQQVAPVVQKRVMFCRFCGFDVSKDANPTFCRKCGKDLRKK